MHPTLLIDVDSMNISAKTSNKSSEVRRALIMDYLFKVAAKAAIKESMGAGPNKPARVDSQESMREAGQNCSAEVCRSQFVYTFINRSA